MSVFREYTSLNYTELYPIEGIIILMAKQHKCMTLKLNRKSLFENRLSILLLLIFITITNNSIYAEGTKELSPNPSDRVFLYLNGDLYNNFGRYNGNADQRLFFHIADPNQEQVFLGFSQACI